MTATELIDVPILRLTERAGALTTVATKAHPKYLRRMKELRLAQPLPAERLGDLSYFTNLRQLYLDCGTDRPSTLEAMSHYIAAPLPLSVMVGLSIDRRPIELARGVNIWRMYLEVSTTERPLLFGDDATLIEVSVDASGTLPNLSTWQRLRDFEIELGIGASVHDVSLPPNLENIGLTANDCFSLGGKVEGHVPQPWTAERRNRTHLRLAGDVGGFKRLSIHGEVAFSGVPLIGVEELLFTINGVSERALRTIVIGVPAVRKIRLRFAHGVDYAALVRDFPTIKRLDFSLDNVSEKSRVETLAARLRERGCRTTAAVSTGTFVEDTYDSDSDTWQSYSSR